MDKPSARIKQFSDNATIYSARSAIESRELRELRARTRHQFALGLLVGLCIGTAGGITALAFALVK
jgi:hypothetical protein